MLLGFEALKELCKPAGVSGFETDIRAYLKAKLTEMGVEYTIDKLGSVIAHNKGKNAGKTIMVEAHIDEVGLIVTGIDEGGFIKFRTVGAVDTIVLAAKTVYIGEKKVPGVIGSPPIHFMKPEERGKRVDVNRMHIDIGASDKKAAEKLVSIGDYIMFGGEPVEFGDGLIKARALDDRAGCGVMLELLAAKLDLDFYCVFAVMEETGGRGAKVAAHKLQPDLSFSLEGTVSADMGEIKDYQKVTVLGKGPAISVMDSGTIYNPQIIKHIVEVAEKNNIPYQFRRTIMGGTDAAHVQRSRGGCMVANISVPCRYIHSPICVCSKNDFANTVELMKALLLAELN